MGRPATDLTNQRFGRLSVISCCGSTPDGRALWACVCDCGTRCAVPGATLRAGRSKSCGCLLREQNRDPIKIAKLTLPDGLGKKRRAFRSYKDGARLRELPFEITLEYFLKLITSPCAYCGGTEGVGVDRINNEHGYTVRNTAPSCSICNRAKFNMTAHAFKTWVRQAAAYGGPIP